MKEFIVHRRAMAGGCHLVFRNKNGMTVYRVKKKICWMDDLPLTDHKGNTMARIQCESLFVPNEYIISYANEYIISRRFCETRARLGPWCTFKTETRTATRTTLATPFGPIGADDTTRCSLSMTTTRKSLWQPSHVKSATFRAATFFGW